MVQHDFKVSLAQHNKQIQDMILAAHQEALRKNSGCSLLNGDQVRLPGSVLSKIEFGKNNVYINEEKLGNAYKLGTDPYFDTIEICKFKSWNWTEE